MYALLYNNEIKFTAKTEAECWLEKHRIAKPIIYGQSIGFWEVKEIDNTKK